MPLRKNPKHKCFVKGEYLRVYYSGMYALWEIDVGRIGHGELVLLLGCTDALAILKYNKPHTYSTHIIF